MRRVFTTGTIGRLKQTQRFLNIKKVLLLSSNASKEIEYRQNFSLYGVDVERVNPSLLSDRDYQALLKTPNVIALLRDSTSLFKKNTKTMADVEHLELVDNHTLLEVLTLDSDKVHSKVYEHTTTGFLDFEKKKPSVLKVFGWDDIFTVQVTGRTYLEMDIVGGKISSRCSKGLHDRWNFKFQNSGVQQGLSIRSKCTTGSDQGGHIQGFDTMLPLCNPWDY
jgi:inosine/xanthosine triphosphate pyrophosphatase family protein